MDYEKKISFAIKLLQSIPQDGTIEVCYSGGKDSDVIRILAALADVPHELHHNLTTVDAPETIQYIKSIPNVIIDKARYADGTPKTMWNLIPKKLIPPTRLARWCCSELKEGCGKGRLKVTGVRWEESVARAKRSGVVNIIGKPNQTQKFMSDNNVNFLLTNKGGWC